MVLGMVVTGLTKSVVLVFSPGRWSWMLVTVGVVVWLILWSRIEDFGGFGGIFLFDTMDENNLKKSCNRIWWILLVWVVFVLNIKGVEERWRWKKRWFFFLEEGFGYVMWLGLYSNNLKVGQVEVFLTLCGFEGERGVKWNSCGVVY